MQALNLKSQLNTAFLILLLSFVTQGCGWQKTMTFPSPSRKAAIEIWQTGIANEYGTRVKLVTGHRSIIVFENRRDAIVYFVHVYWSPDESKVGVLATGMSIWNVAFDVRKGRPVPFEDVRKGFGESIREIYSVPPGKDPINWAASSDAHSEFFKLHPEVRLSYH